MGRRDEPELDELSKLLRRLETMEVAPKQESSRKAEPDDAQPQPEYVGALRGAPPAKVSDGRSVSSYEARPSRAHETQSPADKSGRPASTSAIVIGATTAAVDRACRQSCVTARRSAEGRKKAATRRGERVAANCSRQGKRGLAGSGALGGRGPTRGGL